MNFLKLVVVLLNLSVKSKNPFKRGPVYRGPKAYYIIKLERGLLLKANDTRKVY